MVTADQVTILGNGTTADPLRLHPSSELTFLAAIPAGAPLIPGLSVVIGGPDVDGIPTIIDVGGIRRPQISGLLISLANGVGVVQFAGVVSLTTEEWDAVVTGPGGGLQVGLIYYVEMIGDRGRLTSTKPTTTGTFVIQVGIALSPTSLLLGAPYPFTQN